MSSSVLISKAPIAQKDDQVLGGLKINRNQGYFTGLIRKITNEFNKDPLKTKIH
jgi:hypothetical protein